MPIPLIESEEELTVLKRDAGRSLEVLHGVAKHARLAEAEIERFSEGSAIVGGNGDVVLKVFAPFDAAYARTEARVLAFLDGQLPCPTPKLVRAETCEGWPYVVMSRIPGTLLSTVWGDLDARTRHRLSAEIGAIVRQLHLLDPSEVEDLPPSWDSFIAGQRARAVARQRELGLDAHWLDQIAAFLTRFGFARQGNESRRSLLHTEWMIEHVFVEESSSGQWQICGCIDFEPAMVGVPEYDFASVGLFVSRGDPRLFAAFLDGYGVAEADRGPDLSCRALCYALLHRYAHFPWYLDRLAPVRASTLEELAAEWY